MSDSFTVDEIERAAKVASARIISMVMKGCQRKQLHGMPYVGDKLMQWDEYIAWSVRNELENPSVAADPAPASTVDLGEA